MKEFKCALKYVFIFQLFIWSIFVVGYGIYRLILGLAGQVITSCFYILNYKRIIEINKFDKQKFNFFLMLLWITFTVIFGFIVPEIIECSGTGEFECFLEGMTGATFCIMMYFQFVINMIVKLIFLIANRIYKLFK